jgi:hypothetical protein
MSKNPPPYVSKADGNEIIVEAVEAPTRALLTAIGFVAQSGSNDVYLLSVNGEREKAQIFSKLRDAGICFARGKEWSPAEVFEWLKEQGFLTGSFKSIAWRGPDDWLLRDEP